MGETREAELPPLPEEIARKIGLLMHSCRNGGSGNEEYDDLDLAIRRALGEPRVSPAPAPERSADDTELVLAMMDLEMAAIGDPNDEEGGLVSEHHREARNKLFAAIESYASRQAELGRVSPAQPSEEAMAAYHAVALEQAIEMIRRNLPMDATAESFRAAHLARVRAAYAERLLDGNSFMVTPGSGVPSGPQPPTIACEVCGKGPSPDRGGVTVYRENEPGQVPAIWRCREDQTKASPEQGVVDVLESGPQPPTPTGIPEGMEMLDSLKAMILSLRYYVDDYTARDEYDLCESDAIARLAEVRSVLSQAEARLALLTQQLANMTASNVTGWREARRLEAENAQLRNEGKSLAQWIGTLFTSFNTSTPEGVRAGVESLRSEVAQLRKDRVRMDLLENNSPDKVYFRDGKEISCRGQTLRSTIDNATHYLCSGAARSAPLGDTAP